MKKLGGQMLGCRWTKLLPWLNDQVTKWPGDRISEWPSDQVTMWPSDWVTEWPSDRKLRRRLNVWYISFYRMQCTMSRLNWKIQNHTFSEKNCFLKVVLYVFLVTDQLCIKWLSPKNVIFCPKNAFFWQKMQYIHLCRPLPLWCQRTFFSYGILLLKSWRIFWGKLRNMVKHPSEHFQFIPKLAIFRDKKKKVYQKWF